ncbi:MAG: T9SS type A sorting domain-containing protein, partial [Calditrichaeota bacterium]|nr:T9SS type A sorting domain-containing protein [Calditrichota bacterium]
FIADVFFQDNTLLTDSIDYQVTLVKESYTHEVSEKISIKLNDKTSENTSIISSYSKKTGSFELSSNQKNDLNFDLKYTLTGESSEDINQQFEVYSSGEWKQITTYHNSLSNQLEASYNQFGKYRLTTHADSFENRRADTFSTVQNYPNPFNPTTTIHFYLSSETQVSLKIYNNLGQIIRTLINEQLMPASQYNFEWDGKNQHGKTVSSGIYFYQLKSGKSVITKKMLLIK